MGFLDLVNIKKAFGEAKVLEGINLSIEKGQFVSLLGASGSGKSTCLGIVAGFLGPDSGSVVINGTDVTSFEPRKRNIGMVFQDYALFPHMTVAENVGFGLKMRHCSKKERLQRVKRVLDKVGLNEYINRLPKELSGGQQQRVALARALVLEPELLLLDEPLSNLDAKLRDRMRGELRRIQEEFAVTTLFVTHDQAEAMALSDMIAIIDKGHIVQFGSPKDIYVNPQSAFVADFIGRINFIDAVITEKNELVIDEYTAVDNAGRKWAGSIAFRTIDLNEGHQVVAAFRPEDITIIASDDSSDCGVNFFGAQITEVAYQGSFALVTLRVDRTNEEVVYMAMKDFEELRPGSSQRFRVTRVQLM